MAEDAVKAAFFAGVGSRAFFYHPRQGQLLVFNTVPGIRGAMENNAFQFGCTFSDKSTATSTSQGPRYGGVFIDVPSIRGARISRVVSCSR